MATTNSGIIFKRLGLIALGVGLSVLGLMSVSTAAPTSLSQRSDASGLVHLDLQLYEVPAAALARLGLPRPAEIGEGGEELAARLMAIQDEAVDRLADIAYSVPQGRSTEFSSKQEVPFATTSSAGTKSLGGYAQARLNLTLSAHAIDGGSLWIDSSYSVTSFGRTEIEDLPPGRVTRTGRLSAITTDGTATVTGALVGGGPDRSYFFWVIRGGMDSVE